MLRTRVTFGTLALVALIGAVPTTLADGSSSLMDRASREFRYEISRNGDRIGTHYVRVQQRDEARIVDHRIRISVRVLGIEAYHYELSAQERWEEDRLVHLWSRVDRNGQPLRTSARLDASGIRIRKPDGRAVRAPATSVVADPHLEVLQPGRAYMIEAEDGSLRSVSIRRLSRQRVEAGGRSVECRRYEVTGDHTATLWYDVSGVLVKKRLRAPDGSTVVTTLE